MTTPARVERRGPRLTGNLGGALSFRAMRVIAATMLLSLFASGQPAAQEKTTEAQLRRVTEDLYQAALKARTVTTPASLLTSVTWLRDSVRRPAFWSGPVTNAADVSPEYVQSLQTAADLLRARPSEQVVNDVAEDLSLKVQHCRDLNIGMGGGVKLTVNTRRGDGSVRNLQVRYLLKFYESIKGAQPGTFGRLSSPTDMTLPPGLYWIWAVDPATGASSTRTLVRAAGQKELVVDVPVG
jgi:hypothetical protein